MLDTAGSRRLNEDLIRAFKVRQKYAYDQQSRDLHKYNQAVDKLLNTSAKISVSRKGNVNGAPKLEPKPINLLLHEIIRGKDEIVPAKYTAAAADVGENVGGNDQTVFRLRAMEQHLEVMAERSVPEAILMVLKQKFDQEGTGNYMTQDEIQHPELWQKYCDVDMSEHSGAIAAAARGQLWGVGNLVLKYFVDEDKSQPPTRYALTTLGRQAVENLGNRDARESTSSNMWHRQLPGRDFSDDPSKEKRSLSAYTCKNVVNAKDEKELIDFVCAFQQSPSTAPNQMTFEVANARRRHLHQCCEELEKKSNITIAHESDKNSDSAAAWGGSTRNKLIITLKIAGGEKTSSDPSSLSSASSHQSSSASSSSSSSTNSENRKSESSNIDNMKSETSSGENDSAASSSNSKTVIGSLPTPRRNSIPGGANAVNNFIGETLASLPASIPSLSQLQVPAQNQIPLAKPQGPSAEEIRAIRAALFSKRAADTDNDDAPPRKQPRMEDGSAW